MDVIDHSPLGHTVGAWLAPTGLSVLVLSFLGAVPILIGTAAGTAAFCVYSLQIWESKTVTEWRHTRAARIRLNKVSILQRQQNKIMNELKLLGVLSRAETTVTDSNQTTTVTTKDDATD